MEDFKAAVEKETDSETKAELNEEVKQSEFRIAELEKDNYDLVQKLEKVGVKVVQRKKEIQGHEARLEPDLQYRISVYSSQ